MLLSMVVGIPSVLGAVAGNPSIASDSGSDLLLVFKISLDS